MDGPREGDSKSQGHSRAVSSAALPPRPTIICLCGSTRFTEQMLIKQWELTKKGYIVLSWCALPDSYNARPHIADREGVKETVDELHKRKIDLADLVFILNIGGYIGDSTRSEIEYALAHSKPVLYLESPEKQTPRAPSKEDKN